jgi:hypothetical protein
MHTRAAGEFATDLPLSPFPNNFNKFASFNWNYCEDHVFLSRLYIPSVHEMKE